MDFKKLNEEQKNELRREMGTLPEENVEFADTIIYKGVTGINVEMYSTPDNYAKILVENVVATWGDEQFLSKWPKIKPELRFLIAKAVLTGQTLPQAQEGLVFHFTVRGVSRAAFDQHARQRLGTFFQSQGVRDNSRLDASFRMPTDTYNDPELRKEVCNYIAHWKRLYKKILTTKGVGSFQEARQIMPMNATHNYKFGANYSALKGFCAQRLMACEQFDTVQTAILVRAAVELYSPYLASLLRPRCDMAKKCVYHQDYTLSEAFGCLFRGCGRWPDGVPYATHNKSCSDYDTMANESGVRLPDHLDWKTYNSYDELEELDKKFFNADWCSYSVGRNFESIKRDSNKLTEEDKLFIVKLEQDGYVTSKDIINHMKHYE